MRQATCSLRVLAALLLAVPAFAAAQAATVDQVLAALAEVLRDRAKQVASAAIAEQLRKQLCHGTVTVRPHRSGSDLTCRVAEAASQGHPTAAAIANGQPTCDGALTLYLGGRDGCRDATGACRPDDVFVRSCRLAASQDLPLSDPYYLKSLSRDALDFLLRVSASGLSEEQFLSHGLGDIAQYVHAVLEQAVSRSVRIGDLAAPTLSLADALDRQMPRTTLETVGRDPTTVALRSAVAGMARPWVANGCPGVALKACAKAGSRLETWFVAPVAEPDPAQCQRFRESAPERGEAFGKLFGSGAPYEAARSDACSDKLPDPANCRLGRLTLNLHDALTKVACARGAGEAGIRATLRELIYVLVELDVYEPTLAGDPAAKDAYSKWLDSVALLDLRDLPREELAYGVRVMGIYLRSVQEDPVATGRWLELLAQDLNAFDLRAGAAGSDELKRYRDLLHGAALASGKEPGSAPVRELRGAVKDLLVLPMLVVVKHEPLVDAVARTRTALLVVIRKIQRDPGEQPRSLEAVLASLSDFVSALAELSRELGKGAIATPPKDFGVRAAEAAASPAGPLAAPGPADAATLFRVADALDEAANALRLASSRDWVGLAVLAADEVEHRVKDRSEFERLLPSLRFVRVLLSMYQAADVAQAKAIFQANLEDISSRAHRYDQFAVDAGALVGLRWGYQRTRVYADGSSALVHPFPQIYGLLAPFGIQVTFPLPLHFTRLHAGVLAYPIELGSYLVVNDSQTQKPIWQDAFRLGASPFLRLDRNIPIVLGVGGDVRPRVNDRVEWRAYVHLALELPLYILY
jgi:hypothetical protein